MSAVVDSQDEMFLQGKRVAFLGKLGGITRREAKQLVRTYGGSVAEDFDQHDMADVDLIVIGADELPLSTHGDLLTEEIRRKAGTGALEIISETQLWQRLGMIEQEKNVRQLYTPAMLAELIGVPVRTVRRWHRRGLIVPAREVRKLPYFDFLEVATARSLARMLDAGVAPSEIENKLSQLAQFVPSVERPLAQLSVIVEGKELLLRRGGGLVEPGGQLRIDFDLYEELAQQRNDETENAPATLPLPIFGRDADGEGGFDGKTPAEMLEIAEAYEIDCQFESAAETYRAMLMAFGPKAEINFQLAELLYRMGDTVAARERYYMAIELDEEFVEARANLGCVLVELNQLDLAVSAFEGALRYHPDYPDVHFHLARVCERLQESDEAQAHWRRFVELAPDSPWADEAMSQLTSEDL